MKHQFKERKAELRKELIAARESTGMTQREASEHLGESHNFVNFVERKDNDPEKPPRRLDVLEFIQYIQAFGGKPSEIVARLEKIKK